MKKFLLIATLTCAGLLALAYWLFVSPQGPNLDEELFDGPTSDKSLSVVSSEKMGDSSYSDDEEGSEESGKGMGKGREGHSGTKPDLRLVKQYLRESGIEKEFYDLDEMLDRQIAEMVEDSDLSDKDKDKIAKIFKDHINGEDLLQAYEKEMEKNFSAEEIQELNEIMHDPIVQKVYDNARNTDPKQMQAQYMDFVNDQKSNPPSEDRRQTITRLVESSKNADFMADVTVTMAESLSKYLTPSEAPPSKEEMRVFREQITQQAKANIWDGMLFQGRDLSDEELKKFVEKKSSGVSVKEESLRQGVSKEIISKLFGRIGEAFNEKKN